MSIRLTIIGCEWPLALQSHGTVSTVQGKT